ncbi:hypothetical protein ETAA8_59500 [Anatilimnocola aggregata]|uniref:Co-chaperone DjlA N-terminal domain-containing protein n=1 Tax=Anatilimnocola aggregata TaxID=2528021 RepID=A0A517YKP5_9BACT|nr:hypothetical protein [Anatilimnocola aggregata]QDU30801.1 hypothetical protein ETAA8_59500 [Anatilimnocola aggregata]
MTRSDFDGLYARGKSLEDLFFAKRDSELAAALQRKYTAEEKEQLLAMAVNIRDDKTLGEIAKLDSGVEIVAAMALLPLVEVAWCDGDVSPAEKAAVLKSAVEMGVDLDSPMYQLLQGWLGQRPTPAAIEAWKGYVKALIATVTPDTADKIRHGVLGRTEKIAQAAGGFLGLGSKISAAEKACLNDLATAFEPPASEPT